MEKPPAQKPLTRQPTLSLLRAARRVNDLRTECAAMVNTPVSAGSSVSWPQFRLIRRRQVTFLRKFTSQFVWGGLGGSCVAQARPVWRRANLAYGKALRRERAAKPSAGEGPEFAEESIGQQRGWNRPRLPPVAGSVTFRHCASAGGAFSGCPFHVGDRC
jgi:hypothetical protein